MVVRKDVTQEVRPFLLFVLLKNHISKLLNIVAEK